MPTGQGVTGKAPKVPEAPLVKDFDFLDDE
jgi:hypothetical protein